MHDQELMAILKLSKLLNGVSDMGFKLLFRFRSGTHNLNRELGRHSTIGTIVKLVCLVSVSV